LQVIIVTTSPSSNFVPNILSKSHNYAAVSKLVSSAALSASSHKQTMVISAGSAAALGPSPVAVTTTVSSTPSVGCSPSHMGGSSAAVKLSSTRLPSPKSLVSSPSQILQIPKAQQQTVVQAASPKGLQASLSSPQSSAAGAKPTIQIKQESGSQASYTRPSVSPAIGARVATSPAGATYVKTTSGSIITVVPKSLATLGGKILTTNMVSGTSTKITTIPMTSKPNVIVVQKTTGKGTTIQGLPGKNVVTTLLNAGGEKTLQAVPGAKPAIITASRPITKMIVTQPKSLGAGVQPSTKIIPTKIVYGQQGKTQVLIKPKPMAFQTAVVSEQTRQLVSETLQQVSRSAESGQEGAHKDDSPSYTETSDSTHDAHPVVHLITSRGQEWTEQEVSVEASPTIIYQDMTGESQSATSTIKALLELQQTSVKEKSDARPRQNTIDLSQMAVPIPVTERRQSPEPSGQSAGDTDTVTEYIPIGNLNTSLYIRAESPKYMNSPSPSASASAASGHTTQQVEACVPQVKPLQEQMVVEEGESEGDTLDPQTGLFYRSSQPKPAADPSDTPTSSKRAEPLTARVTVQRVSVSASAALVSSTPPHTPQLPRLQQAPSSHNRPKTHTQLSQPPPLQAHHPVGSSKTPGCSQVQQPIITQGASVTKITFGAHQCPPVSSSGEASVKLQPESSSSRPAPEKPSDILKISMMEAEIEPMVVDSSSDCGPLTKTPSASPLISSSKQTLAHGAFGRVKSKDLDIIQVLLQLHSVQY
ncbi:hypothetical protein cypCar_00042663, partial [Cyprinus carpio]